MSLANLVDAALNDRAIVFGSLPPGGRDLDLLVREHSARAVTSALEKAGAVSVAEEWALFKGCKVDSVDLVPASDWRITPGALAALFEDSLPLPGFTHIRRPAARHVLLILARRKAFDTEALADKHRARIADALAEDRAGWASARAEAESWRAVSALECLHRSYQGRRPSGRLVAKARAEIAGGSPLRGWASLIPRRRVGAVIALSGLDGSGKSTQARHLKEVLQRLGIDAVVEWNRITANPSLDVIAAPVKRLLGSRSDASGSPTSKPGDATAHPLRERSRSVNYAWAAIVALANASAHRRAVGRHIRNGRVVICDRYVLDSIAHLRDVYGRNSRFRLQTAIIKVLSPSPSASYWLDVEPSVALARKADEYTLEELTTQRRLYEDLYPSVRAVRIDGGQSEKKICETIAKDCWPRL